MKPSWRPGRLGGAFWVLAFFMPVSWVLAATAVPKHFPSAEAGVAALIEAVKAEKPAGLLALLGSQGNRLISSGDTVADRISREAFLAAYEESNKLVFDGESKATLVIGKDEWPLPIPLVNSKDGWYFDTRKGEREILARRIGRNELSAMQVCLAIVDAEREYAARDPDGDGRLHYAAKFVSAPDIRDGLYWPTQADQSASPLGPLLADAAREGYIGTDAHPLAPYHGYVYRILTRQGKDAPGGAYDYLAKGRLTGGFAVIAYPARYGASGVMSFIVNQDGIVYEKNLGRNTGIAASKMTTYNPDATWKRAERER